MSLSKLKEFKCQCGSTEVRIFATYEFAYQVNPRQGLLVPVERLENLVVADNMEWEKIHGECLSCEATVPDETLRPIDSDDFYDMRP